VCYFGREKKTDNEKMAIAASKVDMLDWPSRMHAIPKNRGQLREYWVLFLSLLGKVKKDRLSDHINITLALLANAVSTVLIYFVFQNYFNAEIAIIISFFYATSFWPYHVAIYMGHIHLSQMFFLLSVLCVQNSGSLEIPTSFLMLFLAGIFIAVSFFSSSASRKYPPIILLAMLFEFKDRIVENPLSNIFITESIVVLTLSIFFVVLKILMSFYPDHIRIFLTKLTGLKKIKEYHVNSFFISILLLLTVIWGLMLIFDLSIFWYFLVFISGVFIIALHVLLPIKNFLENVSRYYVWLNVSSWASHFNAYPDKLGTFGVDIGNDFKGGGVIWMHKFFLVSMPLIYPLYLISIAFILIDDSVSLLNSVFIFFASMMPILIHEITGGLKVGKAFLSVLIFLLIPIAVATNVILNVYIVDESHFLIFWLVFISLIFLHFIYSLKTLYEDIIPSRMAATILRNELKSRNISSFYTYNNSYNDGLVFSMLNQYPNEFNVQYIDRISDLDKGVLVVPGTSSKSVQMETQQFSIINGDFRKDPILNAIIDDKSIEKKSFAKIKTMGCSKHYVHESEVTSYRDLILNQINYYDRWVAHAWIINIEDIE
jgi:hypothetical protein